MRGTFRRLILLLLVLCISHCTGSRGLPENADGTLGHTTKDFYHADSATHATIISISQSESSAAAVIRGALSGGAITSASEYSWDAGSGLSPAVSLDISDIQISLSGSYLTLKSRTAKEGGLVDIFELRSLAPAQLSVANVSDIKATIDTICVGMPDGSNIGQTPYSELNFLIQNGAYSLVAVGKGQNAIIGTATKTATDSITTFHVENFATLDISNAQPYAEDNSYFLASVTGSSVGAVTNLYCHLNQNSGGPIASASPQVSPSGTPDPSPSASASPLAHTVLCTELHRQGMLSDAVWLADGEYGKTHVSAETLRNYHVWGSVLARGMQKSSLLTYALKPFITAWAEQMAYKMGAYPTPNALGEFLEGYGVPLSNFFGSWILRISQAPPTG